MHFKVTCADFLALLVFFFNSVSGKLSSSPELLSESDNEAFLTLSGSTSDSLMNLMPAWSSCSLVLACWNLETKLSAIERSNDRMIKQMKLFRWFLIFVWKQWSFVFRAFCPIKWMAGMNPNIFQLSRGWVHQRKAQMLPSRCTLPPQTDVTDFDVHSPGHHVHQFWFVCSQKFDRMVQISSTL